MDKRLLLASPHMSDEGYELEYIHDAFQKNWIAPLGENVNEFEKAMGEFMGEGYPVALSAGTAALHLAMILAGVKAGDTVFLPEPDLLRLRQSRGLLRREAGVHRLRAGDMEHGPCRSAPRLCAARHTQGRGRCPPVRQPYQAGRDYRHLP